MEVYNIKCIIHTVNEWEQVHDLMQRARANLANNPDTFREQISASGLSEDAFMQLTEKMGSTFDDITEVRPPPFVPYISLFCLYCFVFQPRGCTQDMCRSVCSCGSMFRFP